ncbi:tRNA (adenine(22)-N(1))-methyltransferase TrmK [Sporosarcina sp. HYO08]|uniref:tRNA (adenine(22)-N(1))-methyltransferase n=1 Tax=Sporosarcina sp. HYO08 TaxID=1759557 RepID=UPI0007993E95|nr:tRNA (adenine(22)-N(1))-methyltransferase TrmK [Sporosarcina sp. HYO08]KXH87418.1 SAM-dependent methyltransferase [Sporosarcina sp. HYO08]
MKTERLSERLLAVASFVEPNAVLADIGSDHAYLPSYLIRSGKIQKAIAGEVVKGPYEAALRNVTREGLADSIVIRLADGLAAIEEGDRVDTVSIAGMGGTLIASILENGKHRLQPVKRLITQPNIHAKAIRDWAVQNGWKIIDEVILKEDEKIYEIVCLERGMETYSELERIVGPFLLQEKTAVFIEKWERELAEWKRVLRSLEQAQQSEEILQKKAQLERQIHLVEKVLSA